MILLLIVWKENFSCGLFTHLELSTIKYLCIYYTSLSVTITMQYQVTFNHTVSFEYKASIVLVVCNLNYSSSFHFYPLWLVLLFLSSTKI